MPTVSTYYIFSSPIPSSISSGASLLSACWMRLVALNFREFFYAAFRKSIWSNNLSITGSADANEALQISLVTPSVNGATSLHTFHPRFTYPIFGDEESIFGYQDLNINLKFNASDMRPGLQITYNKKFKAVGDVEPADLKEILEPFLPKSAYCLALVDRS
jgi:hypothetical protein